MLLEAPPKPTLYFWVAQGICEPIVFVSSFRVPFLVVLEGNPQGKQHIFCGCPKNQRHTEVGLVRCGFGLSCGSDSPGSTRLLQITCNECQAVQWPPEAADAGTRLAVAF